jgi:hypothetical protein
LPKKTTQNYPKYPNLPKLMDVSSNCQLEIPRHSYNLAPRFVYPLGWDWDAMGVGNM